MIVTDSKGLSSTPDQFLTSTSNNSPVDDAGEDQFVELVGSIIQLNGSQSYHIEGDPITYLWSMKSKLIGSEAKLSDPSLPEPTFSADVNGSYIAELVVSEGVIVFYWQDNCNLFKLTQTLQFESIIFEKENKLESELR